MIYYSLYNLITYEFDEGSRESKPVDNYFVSISYETVDEFLKNKKTYYINIFNDYLDTFGNDKRLVNIFTSDNLLKQLLLNCQSQIISIKKHCLFLLHFEYKENIEFFIYDTNTDYLVDPKTNEKINRLDSIDKRAKRFQTFVGNSIMIKIKNDHVYIDDHWTMTHTLTRYDPTSLNFPYGKELAKLKCKSIKYLVE